MMISTKKGFGFICVPKCASTTIEAVIRPHCNIRLSGNPRIKHITYSEVRESFFPLMTKNGLNMPYMFAVMRNPVSWVDSWHRYRSRDELKGRPAYCGHLSLEEFIVACCSENAPTFARIKNQARCVIDGEGAVAIDHVIRYETLAQDFPQLMARFGIEVHELPIKNPSPDRQENKIKISSEIIELMQTKFTKDFEIYNAL